MQKQSETPIGSFATVLRSGTPRRSALNSESRREALGRMLIELRDQERGKLEEWIRHQAEQNIASCADESDAARLQEEIDLNISLVELMEKRLDGIVSALVRLEQGRFGICEECEDEISFERLRAVPMARCCLECQQKIETFSGAGAKRVTSAAQMISLFDGYPTDKEWSEPIESDAPPIEVAPRARRGRPRRATR